MQKDVDDWAQQFEDPYWHPLGIMTRLAEETGELAREVNHRFGPKKKKEEEDKQDLGDEIADVFMTLFCLANSQGIDMDKRWERLVEKLHGRDTARFKEQEGS